MIKGWIKPMKYTKNEKKGTTTATAAKIKGGVYFLQRNFRDLKGEQNGAYREKEVEKVKRDDIIGGGGINCRQTSPPSRR